MNNKELYLSRENLSEDIDNLINEIRKAGTRERKTDLSSTRPALLVTDMQEYFLSPESHAFIPSAEAIIPNINLLIHHFHKNNYPVIFTKHMNSEADAGNMKTWWKDLITADSALSSLSPNLQIPQSPNPPIPQSSNPPILQSPNPPIFQAPNLPILKKIQYDAFYKTGLEKFLRELEVDTLIITGVMTNLCCETTLRSAFIRGFKAIMPLDSTATYRRVHHISTFINLSFGFCPVRLTSEILEMLP